jgi:hypothetical protein
MKLKHMISGFATLLLLVLPASADLNNTVIQTTVVSTPYLDTTIWILVTLLGLGFLILSNLAKPDQNPALWAIIAPFFIGPASYFSLQVGSTAFVPYLDDSMVMHVSIEEVAFHIEWMAVV